ncbi:MAG TPA: chain length-determining protein [Cellvibrionaceae bacterium]|nr:chain length-determining protein [Cellvibrionaceae bacterium]
MDKVYLKEMLLALKAELIRFRFLVVFLFVMASFAVLGVGVIWPKHYSTSAILFADETNIIQPLLKGAAEMTQIDRSEQASEIIYTRAVMSAAAKTLGLMNDNTPQEQQNQVLRGLRGGLRINKERNNNYFQISYQGGNPDQVFETLNAVVNAFIEHTARKKRDESLGAYTFIDTQVQTYKKQLEAAEEKLKEFNARNTDGTESGVQGRLSQLRQDIETLKLTIEETQSRMASVQRQLGSETQYQQVRGQSDDLRGRRQALVAQMEQLRLSYQDSYPDIVSLKQQIKEIDTSLGKLHSSGDVVSAGGKVENPLYEDLRKQLANAEVDLRTQTRRLESLVALQEEERARAERVAANQAQLSELTRDYDVTKRVYEEMLGKKETARLSMTLDIEGQGVSYRIQEAAQFPLRPTGLNFKHFAALWPILGFLLPIGLLIAYVLVDPHLRSSRILQKQLPPDIELIGSIPHYDTPLGQRLLQKDMIFLLVVVVMTLAAYVATAIYWHINHS